MKRFAPTFTSLLAFGALLAAMPASAADKPMHAAEAARIAVERDDAQSTYAARERQCRDRFAVTACLDEAKRQRRTALDALKERQLVLDEATRRERAGERRNEIAAKASEDARRNEAREAKVKADSAAASAPAGAPPGDPARTTAGGAEVAASAAPRAHAGHAARTIKPAPKPHTAPHPRTAASAAAKREERSEREVTKREAFERHQQDLVEHRQEVAERNARPAKKPRAPLPAPAAASGTAPS